MTYTQDQIIRALIVIKTVCKENENCIKCPFRRNGDECSINNDWGIFPSDWDIADENNWTAFR